MTESRTMESVYETLAKRIKELEAENEMRRKENGSKRAEIDDLEAENEMWRKENGVKLAEIDELQNENQVLRETLSVFIYGIRSK